MAFPCSLPPDSPLPLLSENTGPGTEHEAARFVVRGPCWHVTRTGVSFLPPVALLESQGDGLLSAALPPLSGNDLSLSPSAAMTSVASQLLFLAHRCSSGDVLSV